MYIRMYIVHFLTEAFLRVPAVGLLVLLHLLVLAVQLVQLAPSQVQLTSMVVQELKDPHLTHGRLVLGEGSGKGGLQLVAAFVVVGGEVVLLQRLEGRKQAAMSIDCKR